MMKKHFLLSLLLLAATMLLHAQGEAVDLGLSVKWASCNLGASKPHAFGNYYAWGETQPKSEYTDENNRYFKEIMGDRTFEPIVKAFSKYWIEYIDSRGFRYGTSDGRTVLEAEDDAAQVATHGQWRMPTCQEFDELLRDCEWTWTEQKNVDGYMVTSKINGNSIFLPAAGFMKDAHLLRTGKMGFYWTSSLWAKEPMKASYVGFRKREKCPNVSSKYYQSGENSTERGFGFTIRAVQP